MAEVVKVTSSGIGFTGLLTIIFVLLKAFNVITWSWWWVFAPLWLPITIALGVGIVIFFVVIIAFFLSN